MDDAWVRVLLVGGVAVFAVLVGWATRRWQRPAHPRIDIAGLGLPAGVVIFTSTDCTRCREALAVVKQTAAPVREVTWELEPGLLERAGVTAVPLTVVVGDGGDIVDQFVGVPRARRLRRAVGRTAAT